MALLLLAVRNDRLGRARWRHLGGRAVCARLEGPTRRPEDAVAAVAGKTSPSRKDCARMLYLRFITCHHHCTNHTSSTVYTITATSPSKQESSIRIYSKPYTLLATAPNTSSIAVCGESTPSAVSPLTRSARQPRQRAYQSRLDSRKGWRVLEERLSGW